MSIAPLSFQSILAYDRPSRPGLKASADTVGVSASQISALFGALKAPGVEVDRLSKLIASAQAASVAALVEPEASVSTEKVKSAAEMLSRVYVPDRRTAAPGSPEATSAREPAQTQDIAIAPTTDSPPTAAAADPQDARPSDRSVSASSATAPGQQPPGDAAAATDAETPASEPAASAPPRPTATAPSEPQPAEAAASSEPTPSSSPSSAPWSSSASADPVPTASDSGGRAGLFPPGRGPVGLLFNRRA